ncbi:hypothetical protein GH714_008892 [Hevea brasiliensis]|uniref:Uncharacterized protein n=1 Tax=Hevea brasiliensis TaxID=3981 RepID=A0A6A6KEG7_HEVBR|nr:hypothetical protein GH714_008892 [Hevea brasiliensis]
MFVTVSLFNIYGWKENTKIDGTPNIEKDKNENTNEAKNERENPKAPIELHIIDTPVEDNEVAMMRMLNMYQWMRMRKNN